MIELTSTRQFEFRDRPAFALTPPKELGNPRDWMHTVIRMDGRLGTVIGLEAFANEDVSGTPIALLMDFDLPIHSSEGED